MTKQKRIIPTLFEEGYTVGSCCVCDIDGIIGTEEDLCSHHFSQPGLEYDYGHNIITARADGERCGYYIGRDIFSRRTGAWDKEYALYEFAVNEGEEDTVADLLLSHMRRLAKATGCSRIVCTREGGNAAFDELAAKWGFEKEGDDRILTLAEATLCREDSLVIPKERDRLTHEALFFLREQGFDLDGEACTFTWEGESITVDRKTALCRFSEGFTTLGDLILEGEYALTVIDALCQMMKQGYGKGFIIDPTPKLKPTDPDIVIDDMGVFIGKDMTFRERIDFRRALREEGVLKKYTLHTLSFDFVLGGTRLCFGFSSV